MSKLRGRQGMVGTAAGLAEKAIGYWLKAVQHALARSAMKEAVVQSRKGLEVLADLPESP